VDVDHLLQWDKKMIFIGTWFAAGFITFFGWTAGEKVYEKYIEPETEIHAKK
jgi:hypothetical protein